MEKPNVLFVVMDTARAQNTLPFEQPGILSNINSILEDGIVFSQAVTTSPWTLPSHASMFTGQYTTDHNTHAGSKSFSPSIEPLAEQLRQEGYQTMGISNNSWISPTFGFDKGFNELRQGWELLPADTDLNAIIKETDDRVKQLKRIIGEVTLSDAPATFINAIYSRFFQDRYDNGAYLTNLRIKRWLAKRWDEDKPFFLFANYIEPHLKYDPPQSWLNNHMPEDIDARQLDEANQAQWEYLAGNTEMESWEFRALEALYNAELSYLDHRLGNLLTFIQEQGLFEETLIIVVGDHGENIGDHGLMDHQYSLHETLLRVPLFIRPPGASDYPSSIDKQVEIRDLFPTVLDAVGVPQIRKESVSNNSLLSDDPSCKKAFAEYVVPQPAIETLIEISSGDESSIQEFDRALQSIRTESWKYIRGSDSSEWLFDIDSDPNETENILQSNRETAAELKQCLEDERGELSVSHQKTDGEIDTATERRLKELGYI